MIIRCIVLLTIFTNVLILGKPRLTVILIVDQLAYSYFPKLTPFLKHGIKFLLHEGIVYHNAYFPHAITSTGPGHTGLATGTTASYHGIIANNWYDGQGNKIVCDDDTLDAAAVINPKGGWYDYGKGPSHIMVDSISDQFMLHAEPDTLSYALALSLKSRSAICCANKMGKALWLDAKTGLFTSSKAYYDELPPWLMPFNNNLHLDNLTKIHWPLFYPRHSRAYNFKFIDNYRYSARAPMAGKTITFAHNDHNPLKWYERTPAANQLLFDLAVHSIASILEQDENTHILLWICLSSLDMLGHDFGPYAREVIDMIYHLDYQIQQFMHATSTYIDLEDTVFVLTADHGITPIPELLQQQGYNALRVNNKKMAAHISNALEKELGITNLISRSTSAQLYLNQTVYDSLTTDMQKQSNNFIKSVLANHKGIKRVWTPHELATSCFGPHQIESFYKNQYYPGRSGQFMIQPRPYCLFDDYDKGTGHRTPYDPDTHVPLIVYQKKNLERKSITDKVWTLQLANSLASILHIPKPSASTYSMLPGLINNQPIPAL